MFQYRMHRPCSIRSACGYKPSGNLHFSGLSSNSVFCYCGYAIVWNKEVRFQAALHHVNRATKMDTNRKTALL